MEPVAETTCVQRSPLQSEDVRTHARARRHLPYTATHTDTRACMHAHTHAPCTKTKGEKERVGQRGRKIEGEEMEKETKPYSTNASFIPDQFQCGCGQELHSVILQVTYPDRAVQLYVLVSHFNQLLLTLINIQKEGVSPATSAFQRSHLGLTNDDSRQKKSQKV
jgi:hypothetical protein